MFTVGLTGGVAAGKSTATKFLKVKHVIDADIISRNLQLSRLHKHCGKTWFRDT